MISRVSRNPAVEIRPTRPPLRSTTAFVAVVVPCTNWPTSERATPPSASTSRTPSVRSAGVVNDLDIDSSPVVLSKATRSVNVPPMSTPIRSGLGWVTNQRLC